MARIAKRTLKNGSQSFTAEVRLRGFPHTSKTFRTVSEAQKWAKLTEASMLSGSFNATSRSTQIKFKDAVALFRKSSSLKKSWLRSKNNMRMLSFWEKELGDYKLQAISTSLIFQLRERLLAEKTTRKTPRSQATCNRYLSGLSVIFQCCVEEWGWLERNPVRNLRRLKENPGRSRVLNQEEQNRLLEACSNDQDLEDLVKMGLLTGARRGELQGLMWEDIDFKEKMLCFRDTKNGDNRWIPLTDESFKILNKRYEKSDKNPFNWVFPSSNPLKPQDFHRRFKKALNQANLIDFRFHDLRHCAGSILAESGISDLLIGEILGHKSLEMVKRYSHVRPKNLKESMTVLDSNLS